MISDEDRRTATRFPVSDLDISVHRRGWRGIIGRPPRVRAIDFSLAGVQIEADQHFKVGERVVIDLRFREICLEEINGVVVRIIEAPDAGDEERIGVEFCFESRFMRTPRISSCLRRVESYLKQQQLLGQMADDVGRG